MLNRYLILEFSPFSGGFWSFYFWEGEEKILEREKKKLCGLKNLLYVERNQVSNPVLRREAIIAGKTGKNL